MVIAHVLSSFRVGGQERMALDLARGQRDRGHRVLAVSLAAAAEQPLEDELQRSGIRPVRVAKAGPSVDPTLPLRLAALFRREGVEVVHTHNPQPLIYAGVAGRLVGATVVQTRHGVAQFSRRQVWLARQLARLADAQVMVSRELRAELSSRGAADGEALVIENGIRTEAFGPDPERRAAMRAALGLAPHAFVVGTVGRLIASKGVAELVQATASLLGDDFRLVVVGDGPERARIEGVIAAAAPFVHLLGARADVPDVLRALDAFALFSRTEGHPLSVLEAMATGLPVVATRVGGIPSVVEEGRSGLLVGVDDGPALAAAIQSLRERPAWAAALGRHGRAIACERYSAARMVDEYLALYRSARPGAEGIAC